MSDKWELTRLPDLPQELGTTVNMAAHDLPPLPALPPVVGEAQFAPTMTGEEFYAALLRIGFVTRAEFAAWAGIQPSTVGRWIRNRPPTMAIRLVHAIEAAQEANHPGAPPPAP